MQTKEGFSLIEIIVGLIIISVALACFAPVMSKQVKKSATALSHKLTNRCEVYGLPSECKLCYGKKQCVSCSKECDVDHKLNVSECVCK